MGAGSTARPSDQATLLARVDPDNLFAITWPSDWVQAGQFHAYQAILLVGDRGGGEVRIGFRQATDSIGSGNKVVPGTDSANVAGDDHQAVTDLRPEEIDVDGGFQYIQLLITITGGTGADVAGLLLGYQPRQGPASGRAASTVAEVVD